MNVSNGLNMKCIAGAVKVKWPMNENYVPPGRPDTPEKIVRRLEFLREALEIKTQKAFLKPAHISASAYSNWKKGDWRPDLDQALNLCKVYPITLDYIYRGNKDALPYGLAEKISQLEREDKESTFSESPLAASNENATQ